MRLPLPLAIRIIEATTMVFIIPAIMEDTIQAITAVTTTRITADTTAAILITATATTAGIVTIRS